MTIPVTRAEIDALLPQTQCEKCGFKGCQPYAQALLQGEAEINLCHPGGEITMRALAEKLGRPIQALPEAALPTQTAHIAQIQEDFCIGCKKCIHVCPTDAIMGAPKLMHQVIQGDCTGCELCLPVCPVDCIDMIPAPFNNPTWVIEAPQDRLEKANRSRSLFQRRQARIAVKQQHKQNTDRQIVEKNTYHLDIQAAISRVQKKREKIDFVTNEL